MLCRKESLVLLFTFTFTFFCTYPLPPLSSPALFSIRPNANKKRKNGKLRKADFYFLFGFDKKLSRTFVPIYPYTIAPTPCKKITNGMILVLYQVKKEKGSFRYKYIS